MQFEGLDSDSSAKTKSLGLSENFVVQSLSGLTPYQEARELQLDLVRKRAAGEIGDTLLLLEHLPVITRGRGLQDSAIKGIPRHSPLPAKLPDSIELADTERGGDLTYHGPGQLVIYPIFKLDGKIAPFHDVTAWVRLLEKWTIRFLAQFGIQGEARSGATGVWVTSGAPAKGETLSAPKKIASIGIAVKSWVSYHGIAINIVNDLRPFSLFNPCGFNAEVMTSLEVLAPGQFTQANWRETVERAFVEAINGWI